MLQGQGEVLSSKKECLQEALFFAPSKEELAAE